MWYFFVLNLPKKHLIFNLFIIVRCPNLTLPYFDALFVLLSVTGYELTAKVKPGPSRIVSVCEESQSCVIIWHYLYAIIVWDLLIDDNLKI